ncbi:SAM-dependent methyltransferase [Amycolatopsis minnesotensis]|uniref:SAM-dependent methyltransferase n=1 Tax=Amycolatopsis minnesotensis TaxID=337894 RepID=A0ABP5ECC2_9PSEU
MSVTIEPMPEERGHYWNGKCFSPHGGCGAASIGPHCRIRQQRHWGELPGLCLCYTHISRVENAIVANGERAWLLDRMVAEELKRIAPYAKTALRMRRAFTYRVIEYALAEGITQFVELGSGHLHTSAARAAVIGADAEQDPTIVLVDHDPLVLAHGQGDFEDDPGARHRSAMVRGNVFAVGKMLTHLSRKGLLDLTQRVCVLAVDLVHFAEPEIDGRSVPQRLARHLHPGSLVAITHLTDEPLLAPANPDDLVALRSVTDRWCRAHQRCAPPHPRPCSIDEFARLVADLDLLDPGITTTRCWPEAEETRHPRAPYTLAAVGRVPEHGAQASQTGRS